MRTPNKIGNVIDLFCGVGGLSYGFLRENFNVVAGIDTDAACRYPYEYNNKAVFYHKNIGETDGEWLIENNPEWEYPRILAGCAPCQSFSVYNQKNNDTTQWKLLTEFARLIRETNPDIVTMENVPRLVKYKAGRLFDDFLKNLDGCGYHTRWDIVFCPHYGVPQSRSRLVLIASKNGPIKLQEPAYTEKNDYPTVKCAIGRLPSIGAGETFHDDPLHRAARLSSMNLKRIRQSKPGGTWRDWDKSLVAPCHKKNSGRTYPSVYGRMDWDSPAPTITTQFYGFGNGRFGHPGQARAISLREGALLQSFPENYRFNAPDKPISIKGMGRMIGNAVPPLLARAIARSIAVHIEEIMV